MYFWEILGFLDFIEFGNISEFMECWDISDFMDFCDILDFFDFMEFWDNIDFLDIMEFWIFLMHKVYFYNLRLSKRLGRICKDMAGSPNP